MELFNIIWDFGSYSSLQNPKFLYSYPFPCLHILTGLFSYSYCIYYFFFYLLQEEKLKEYRREKRKERKRKADSSIDEDVGMDPEMAKIMGFGGFSSTKK